jgi:hypothetical protein
MKRASRRALWVLPVWALVIAGVTSGNETDENSSCVTCHRQLEDEMLAPLESWDADVHAQAGLGCEGCHGGDPSPVLAEDIEAMAPERGFRSSPSRLQVADFCARCHSDLSFMRTFDPQARVDQLTEYRLSAHGIGNTHGDATPAVCTDCHGVHGIRPVDSPDSSVYPANVPGMCAGCHSDETKMAPYGTATDPYPQYVASVHGIALLERGDTAAPACNDCHGNHGAAPPGVSSVANVCGQCHGRESNLFRASFKKEIFDDMGVAECSVCHGHHLIEHPTPSLFHSGSAPRVSQGRIVETTPLTADLGRLEPHGTAVMSWRGVLSPYDDPEESDLLHNVEVEAGDLSFDIDATVRPGDRPIATDSRVAGSEDLSATLTVEPVSGVPVEPGDTLMFRLELRTAAGVPSVVVNDRPGKAVGALKGSVCLTCHSEGDECDQATERMFDALSSMDQGLRAAADRLHRAEIAGMEVSEALFDLTSEGRTAAIESRALVHSFEPDRLIGRTEEGREVAVRALAAANAALEEIQFRRIGLAVSLVLIVMVLIGLYLKIRQIDDDRRAQE